MKKLLLSALVLVCAQAAIAQCAGHIASFTGTVSSSGVTFTNTAPLFAGQQRVADWYFGDGGSAMSTNYVSHMYTAAGTYSVLMVCKWVDSFNTATVYCIDSVTSTVTVSAPQNKISGYIIYDTSTQTFSQLKVWLIRYMSSSNLLEAVDSQVVPAYTGTVYTFHNQPAGSYRTKAAAMLNSPASGSGPVPTYHDSSLYWNTATLIAHGGGTTLNRNIYMKTGTLTSGPGFIGGNVNQGANKGTGTAGAGVEGLEIILRDADDRPVRHVFTDASGDYSFSNIPLGTYSIYPEQMNYAAIPYTNVQITASGPSATGFVFGMTDDKIMPKAASGIETAGGEQLYRLYPNPANNRLHIQWSQMPAHADIVITDISGRTVYSSTVAVSGTPSGIDLSQMQPGLYFIKVETGKGHRTDKFVIRR